MHGRTPGNGASIGKRNVLKHGHYTAMAIAARRAIQILPRENRELIQAT